MGTLGSQTVLANLAYQYHLRRPCKPPALQYFYRAKKTNSCRGYLRHSCESQLILTTSDLVQSLDHRSQTDMIIMDFSKTFDTVPHNCLLRKLQNYSVRGHTLNWITNFLEFQKQRVLVGGDFSDWAEVKSWVSPRALS